MFDRNCFLRKIRRLAASGLLLLLVFPPPGEAQRSMSFSHFSSGSFSHSLTGSYGLTGSHTSIGGLGGSYPGPYDTGLLGGFNFGSASSGLSLDGDGPDLSSYLSDGGLDWSGSSRGTSSSGSGFTSGSRGRGNDYAGNGNGRNGVDRLPPFNFSLGSGNGGGPGAPPPLRMAPTPERVPTPPCWSGGGGSGGGSGSGGSSSSDSGSGEAELPLVNVGVLEGSIKMGGAVILDYMALANPELDVVIGAVDATDAALEATTYAVDATVNDREARLLVIVKARRALEKEIKLEKTFPPYSAQRRQLEAIHSELMRELSENNQYLRGHATSGFWDTVTDRGVITREMRVFGRELFFTGVSDAAGHVVGEALEIKQPVREFIDSKLARNLTKAQWKKVDRVGRKLGDMAQEQLVKWSVKKTLKESGFLAVASSSETGGHHPCIDYTLTFLAAAQPTPDLTKQIAFREPMPKLDAMIAPEIPAAVLKEAKETLGLPSLPVLRIQMLQPAEVRFPSSYSRPTWVDAKDHASDSSWASGSSDTSSSSTSEAPSHCSSCDQSTKYYHSWTEGEKHYFQVEDKNGNPWQPPDGKHNSFDGNNVDLFNHPHN